MARYQYHRVAQPTLSADRSSLKALQDLTDYTPRNSQYNTATLQMLEAAVTEAEQAESRAQLALEAARDRLIETSWAFHNAILGAKAEVIAQYGNDSLAVQAIGLKRKSERRRPIRRRETAVE